MPIEGTPVTKSGFVTFSDGRTCQHCKVSSVGGFVVSVTGEGNAWQLSPGLLQLDEHPLWAKVSEVQRQQRLNTYSLNVLQGRNY